MMTLNIHDVSAIDLGIVRSYFCRESNRLFFAREILIKSSTSSFRLSLFAEQSSDLDLESLELLQIPNRLIGSAAHEGALICLKS